MPNIEWDESFPSDTSKVAKAPAYMRNLWKQIALGLDESLKWPGSGTGTDATHGELRQGASKAFFGPESESSYGAGTRRGYLFMASDTSRLFGYGDYDGSQMTYLAGSPFLIEHGDAMPDAVWVMDNGSFATDTGGSVIAGQITMNASYTTEADYPLVFLSGPTTHSGIVTSVVGSAQSSIYFNSSISGPSGSVTYFWTSLGTVRL
jgi:hypothetical protein